MACVAFALAVGMALLSSTAYASERGEEVTLDLTVGAYENVSSGGIDLIYDADVLELVGGTMKTGGVLNHFDADHGKGVFGGPAPMTVSGTILSVTFRIRENAPFGESTVTATVMIRPNGETEITETVTLGTVTVTGAAPESEEKTGSETEKETASETENGSETATEKETDSEPETEAESWTEREMGSEAETETSSRGEPAETEKTGESEGGMLPKGVKTSDGGNGHGGGSPLPWILGGAGLLIAFGVIGFLVSKKHKTK